MVGGDVALFYPFFDNLLIRPVITIAPIQYSVGAITSSSLVENRVRRVLFPYLSVKKRPFFFPVVNQLPLVC